MATVFRYALSGLRGQIIGWGLTMFLLGFMSVPFYDSIVSQADQMEQLLSSFPPELMALFGDFSTSSIVTPEGYLGLQYFDLMAPLILGAFAVLVGSGLLASDEENGRLDLILAHPVSRTALFGGRLLALVAATLAILILSWLGIVILMGQTSMGLSWGEVALPFVSLLAVLLFFGALALLLSMLLPSRRMAAMTASFVLIASYFLVALARISADLETAVKFSPFNYYQSSKAIDGLNAGWFIGLLAVAALFAVLAWWRFERRDIRVAGEGSWRLSLRRRKATV
ncbi:MAG: ABC transporter permease subunit [Anaerolineae bacterium]